MPERELSVDDVVAASGWFRFAAAIRAAAFLDLASTLESGPRPATEIAVAHGWDVRMTRSLFAALASEGVFAEPEPGVFAMNRGATALLPRREGGRRELILGWSGHPALYRALERMGDGVVTGRPAFEIAHGVPFFEWLAAHPGEERDYQAAVGGEDPTEFSSLFDLVDLSGYDIVGDVGGGGGGLLVAALRRWPHLKGMLIDLPSIAAVAADRFRIDGLADQLSVHAADCVIGVPGGADCYVMSTVLRYFDDDKAKRVLDNIAATGGDVILVEMPVADGGAESPGALKSLVETCLTGGADRSTGELIDLLAAAGFEEACAEHWEDQFWVFRGMNPSRHIREIRRSVE